ncbi:MAG TPA: acyl-[ACP]--phospholipid O-acyltransferase [Stellaceae bacterium]|nr:acyl-[ACP]--phospholipid O-acyltransferase [Stellaceae bacterium]
MLALLRTRRFLPLFLTQALGALNDNIFRNALVALVMIRHLDPTLILLTGGLLFLPYALFSLTAGQLADRFNKAMLMRLTKVFELLLMFVALWGFWIDSVTVLMAFMFGVGVQAAFFGPLKYGILPDHLTEQELVGGNALVEAGTYVAIMVGTIAGSWLVAQSHGTSLVPALGIAVAAAGLVASWYVPPTRPAAPDLRISWNAPLETWRLVRLATRNRPVWLSILGLSWFWTFGLIVLSELPEIVNGLKAEELVFTVLLTVFAVGVGCGSILVGRLLKGDISARHVPFAAVGLTVFAVDFAFACWSAGDGMTTVGGLVSHVAGWRMLADLFLLAMCGGIYSVPLFAILQDLSAPELRARMVGAFNIMNAIFVVIGVIIAWIIAEAGVSPAGVLVVAAAVNFGVAVYIATLLPQDILRAIVRHYFAFFHGVEIRGIEHFREAGPRRVVVINHLSFLDGIFVAAHLPGEVTFAVNTQIAQRWWAKAVLSLVKRFEVDPANPYAVKAMIKTVREGTPLAIFPEGRLTRTGALMKIYEGAGTVADRADAEVISVRIDGLQFTRFGYMGRKLRQRWFPKVTMEVRPPVRLAIDPALRGRARRQVVATQLQTLMIETAFATSDTDRTVFSAILGAARRFGAASVAVEDVERRPLTYRKLLLGAVVLGRRLARPSAPGEVVGLLLPNANATIAVLVGLWAFGLVPKPLNFSAGPDAMLATCRATGVRRIVTSRRFVERGKLEKTVERLAESHEIVWLEDFRGRIGALAKLRGLVDVALARRLPGAEGDPDGPAVVLSTSGSEGSPKAVLLSHRNLIANCAQTASVLDFTPADRVLNAMPIFHAFGLTAGTVLPLIYGVPSFLYPSPLHYKIVPELIYDNDTTIVFGTDTFLNGWARFAHPYDFYAVRYIFAGAEKVREATRRLYSDRFGVRLLEGYGATETAPVLSFNTAMHNRFGSAGRFLPGIEWRLEPVPGVEEGGRLHVRGPNIMLGYMRAAAPGVIDPPEDGWYDTGDICRVDPDGFLYILGRAKRFAKIAGEMVSMASAEALAMALWPDAMHAVIAVPDPRKGEALVLATTADAADAAALLAAARERGVPEIQVPRMIRVVAALPLLATGKTDYPAVQRMVAETATAEA